MDSGLSIPGGVAKFLDERQAELDEQQAIIDHDAEQLREYKNSVVEYLKVELLRQISDRIAPLSVEDILEISSASDLSSHWEETEDGLMPGAIEIRFNIYSLDGDEEFYVPSVSFIRDDTGSYKIRGYSKLYGHGPFSDGHCYAYDSLIDALLFGRKKWQRVMEVRADREKREAVSEIKEAIFSPWEREANSMADMASKIFDDYGKDASTLALLAIFYQLREMTERLEV
jgi:hypothetical protein